jgi:hypothetical protein
MKRSARVIIGILVVTLIIGGIFPVRIALATASSAQASGDFQGAITRAAVQIRMFGSIGGETTVAEGLGSIVNEGGEFFIVTHNHWGTVYEALTSVEVRDASNNILSELTSAAFRYLVRYSDAGTLVFQAPIGLVLTDAAAGSAGTLSEIGETRTGDVVQIARHPAGQVSGVEIVEAVVLARFSVEGLPVLGLYGLDGITIVHGDSGGGIWRNGRLVGNMWMTITSILSNGPTKFSITAEVPAAAYAQTADTGSAVGVGQQPTVQVAGGFDPEAGTLDKADLP